MNSKSDRKAALFMLELLLSLFILFLCAVICMQVLVKSIQNQNKADELHHVQTLTANISEILKSGETEAALSQYYPDISIRDNIYILSFDKKWNFIDAADPYYQYMFSVTRENGIRQLHVRCQHFGRNELFYQTTICYPDTDIWEVQKKP